MGNNNLTPTPATEWNNRAAPEGTAVPLPSGNVALVRQLSPEAFLDSGLIPDPLMNIIRTSIHSKKGLPPSTLKKIADDKQMLSDTMRLFDQVLTYVVIEPEIAMPPKCTECGEYFSIPDHVLSNDGSHKYREGVREEGVLYADQVVLDDKIFIFNWCMGGTRDLEKFRQERKTLVGTLSDGEDV